MTGEEMQALGRKTWGRGYQARIARGLSVDVRTVRRWEEGDVPGDRVEAIERLAENKRKATAFARERLDQLLAEAEASGLERSEVLSELTERALLHSSIAALAARRTKGG